MKLLSVTPDRAQLVHTSRTMEMGARYVWAKRMSYVPSRHTPIPSNLPQGSVRAGTLGNTKKVPRTTSDGPERYLRFERDTFSLHGVELRLRLPVSQAGGWLPRAANLIDAHLAEPQKTSSSKGPS